MESNAITGSKLWITIASMLAALMAVLDISIVNVALNDIRASFGTPLDEIAWVSTGYAMANITIIPLSGWLQKRFGYRNYFTISILIFVGASMLCGLAWNLPSLVIFRILQGLGGGAIIPTAQGILFSRYPPKEHGMAGALFGLGSITGPLLGPTLGGYLTDRLSWHWIFYINVPVGLLAAWLAYTHIEEPGFTADKRPVDRWGVGLLAVGMVALQYVLEEGNRDGWFESRTILVLGSVAVIALVTFVVHELESDNPVVDFRIFANLSYTAATALNFLIGTALFAGGYLYSLFCGVVLHYDALDIGLLFLQSSWIQIFLMPIVGRMVGKVDSRYLIAVGLIGVFMSLYLNGHLTAQSDTRSLLAPLFVRACSLGFCFVPLSVVALSSVSFRQRGNAAGLFNMTRELGGSIGTAWMSTQLDRSTKQHFSYLAEHVNVFDPITQEQLASMKANLGGRIADATAGSYGVLSARLSSQSLVLAFGDGFLTLGAAFAVSLLLVFVLAKPDATVDTKAAHLPHSASRSERSRRGSGGDYFSSRYRL